MKKNQSIINRVEQYEFKRGISYIKSNGKFFVTLKIFLSIFFAWAITMNLLTVLSWSIRINTDSFKYISDAFYTMVIFTAISILGFILCFTKFKTIGLFTSICSSIFTIIVYAPLLEDATQTFGYKTIFYTRHLIPHAMIVCMALIMIFVILVEFYKFSATYKKIEKNLYEEFINKKETEALTLTWDEYLESI